MSLTEHELEQLRAMFDLARSGDARLIRYLELGLPPNLTNSVGDTLLVLATYHCHRELVAALLAHGADTERVNDRGQTALGCAVFRRDAELVQMLLDAGADPDGGGRTARELAAFFGLEEMAAMLPAPRDEPPSPSGPPSRG